MERIIKVTLYFILVTTVLAASAYYYARGFYLDMVAEDSPFEYATAFVLLAISVLFFVRLIKVGKSKNKYWWVLNVLIILGAFFGFGEEVSWGQRIFSIESGEFFKQQNLQAETNLHNLEINGVNINKLIFSQLMVVVFGFYFVLSQLVYRKLSFFKNLVDLFGVPIPKIKHTVLMLACTGFILIIPEQRIWELWEAIFVTLLLLVFIEPYNENDKLLVSSGN
jgi:hypothetical protein